MNKKYYIPKEILKKTKEFLMKKGIKHEEGYVLWKGIKLDENQYKVTGIIIPEQTAISHFGGYAFDISSSAIEKVNGELFKNGEMGLIQVHSHPSESTIHSVRDNKLSLLSRKGAISIVVPHFGRMPFEDFQNSTVHIKTDVYEWKVVSKSDVCKILCIVGDTL